MHIPEGGHVHLIAVCGTAMGSLAGMLRERGFRVTGSDSHVYPPMSTMLAEMGVEVQEGFDAGHLGDPDLVVVGNAVSRGNPEVEAMLDRRLPYLSLPEVLRDTFLRGRRPVVVTGTHGKTTTTALAGHLLVHGGLDPSFLVAGVPCDYPRSFRLGNGEHFVIEGDEYDSAFFWKVAKFFFYLPEVLVINNIEFDHADIYANLGEIRRAFRQLINIVPRAGLVLANADDPVVSELLPASFAPVQTFGLGQTAYWRAVDLEPSPQGMRFGLLRQGQRLGTFRLPLHGEYNVRNAMAAVAAALHAGLPVEQVADGLRTFGGVKRRQELLGVTGGITLLDDFAHHPTAVEQTLKALCAAYPGAHFWAVFEPASATNARALFEERYVQAFAAAEHIVIGRVPRPERARQDAPFAPERLVAALVASGREAVHLPDPDDIVQHVGGRASPGDVVVFMSNGAFGDVQRRLLAALQVRFATA